MALLDCFSLILFVLTGSLIGMIIIYKNDGEILMFLLCVHCAAGGMCL